VSATILQHEALRTYARPVEIPAGEETAELTIGRRKVLLTNLQKPYWPHLGITKRDLLQYYADVAPALFPHLCDRAMIMRRYPHGPAGKSIFTKRAAVYPDWIETCGIEDASGSLIDFPIVQNLRAWRRVTAALQQRWKQLQQAQSR
jgi:bifunctional non-homologous end joining protein LigD